MDTPRVVLLIFLIIFLLATPDTQRNSPTQQFDVQQDLQEQRLALTLLNSSSYGDFEASNEKWINITGLRKEDGYAWDLLPKIQAKAKEQSNKVLESWSLIGKSHAVSGEIRDSYGPVETAHGAPLEFANGSLPNGSGHLIPFYQNITGILRGHWIRSMIGSERQPPILNTTVISPSTLYLSKEYRRNVTGHTGDVQLKLDEKRGESLQIGGNAVREVRAEMIIKDERSSDDGWEFVLHGVHYLESGGVLLTTSGERFSGIFALPHFARSEAEFSLAQRLLNRTLMSSIIRQETPSSSPSLPPWSSSLNNPTDLLFPTPHCEYIVYLQQHIPDFSAITIPGGSEYFASLKDIEEELRTPTGAHFNQIPEMKMSAVVFSPDCGFVLESKGPPEYAQREGDHWRGPKLERYLNYVKHCVLAFAFIVNGQLILLKRQMANSSTPSTRSRLSFYTIAALALGDGLICLSLALVSMLISATSLIMMTTSFFSFLGVSFFGMKFLMDIWTVQAPERQEADRRAAADNPTTNTATIITPAGADTLPLPVTARRTTDNDPAVILPPDQDIEATENEETTTNQPSGGITIGSARREMGALYSRFYLTMTCVFLVSLYAVTWPIVVRSIYINCLAFGYLSMWIPQIHRNVIRNCRKALRREFVVGQSILRLIPLVYFYTIEDNLLFIEPDPYAAYLFMSWVWIQVSVLLSQEINPRWFVPSGWAPPAYNYYPILREDDEESGNSMPIGFTHATTDDPGASTPGESKQSSGRIFDCAICMQNIDVPVLPSNQADSEAAPSLGASLFSNNSWRAYMVTPCRHIFHSHCLDSWMKYRLQCPVCRETLPPQ